MYNGIGLKTVRGSGTNGYVQKNLSYISSNRIRLQQQRISGQEDTLIENNVRSSKNAELMQHDKKRKVEVELFKLRVQLEDDGMEELDIVQRLNELRPKLTLAMESEHVFTGDEKDEKKERKIKNAFGISEDYKDGDAFDEEKQELKRNKEMEDKRLRHQQYELRQEAKRNQKSNMASKQKNNNDKKPHEGSHVRDNSRTRGRSSNRDRSLERSSRVRKERSRSRDTRSRNSRSRDTRSRDTRSRDTRSRRGRSRNSRSRDARDSRSRDARRSRMDRSRYERRGRRSYSRSYSRSRSRNPRRPTRRGRSYSSSSSSSDGSSSSYTSDSSQSRSRS